MLVSFGPLVPLVGARVAFGRSVDPAGTMSAAAPVAAGRVAAMRALVVTVIACLAGIVVSPLTTLDPHESVVWLLPALALSAISVAIATYVDSTVPTVSFGIAWLAAVGAWLGDVPRALAWPVGRRARHGSTGGAGGVARGDRRSDRRVLRPA